VIYLNDWQLFFCSGAVFSVRKHFCASQATYWPILNKIFSNFLECFILVGFIWFSEYRHLKDDPNSICNATG